MGKFTKIGHLARTGEFFDLAMLFATVGTVSLMAFKLNFLQPVLWRYPGAWGFAEFITAGLLLALILCIFFLLRWTGARTRPAEQAIMVRGPALLTGLVILVLMTAFQWGKHLVFPSMSLWASHGITNLFGVLVATGVAYLIFGKQKVLYEQAVIEIGQRRHVEEALREVNGTLQSLVQASPLAIIMLDREGNVQTWSPAAERFFGWSAGEVLNRPLPTIPEAQQEDFNLFLAEALEGRSTSYLELRRRRKDGSLIDVSLWPELLHNARGNVVGIVALVADISQRKREEEALRQHQRQLDAMAMELSLAKERERRRIASELHDQVGQTLLLCRIKLKLLEDAMPSGEFDVRAAEIKGLLEQSIQDVRSLTFQLTPALLASAGLDAALAWLGRQLEKDYGLRVEFQGDGQPKPLDEDMGGAIFYAARELLINAAKHAQSPEVRLLVQRDKEMATVTVEDRGVGFDVAPPPSEGGPKGFGLFNIRQKVEYLGGTLMIDSQPGCGTRAVIRAPLKIFRDATVGGGCDH